MPATREPRIGDVPDVAMAIRMAASADGFGLGRTVFFIGAGCSKSAGIPLVGDMAQSLVRRLAETMKCPEKVHKDPDRAYRWLVASKIMRDCFEGESSRDDLPDNRPIDWSRVYDALFSDHYVTPDDVREIFSGFVDHVKGQINWAHLCLGELVKQRLVSTVLTTNFDQLVLAGLVHSGVLPVICDGIESLTRIRGTPINAQIIELHGSRHTYRLRNSPSDVALLANDEQTITAIGSIFQDLRAFVVVGYGGRERGIMSLLIKAAERFADKRLIWVAHSADPARLSDQARQFLATSQNACLLLDHDADSFFLRLLQALRIGAPEAVREPLFLAKLHASNLAAHGDKAIAERLSIIAEIERHRGEINAMDSALQLHRQQRSLSETTLVKARELRLAGKLRETIDLICAIPEAFRSQPLLEILGEAALEHGRAAGDQRALLVAADAWRQILRSNNNMK